MGKKWRSPSQAEKGCSDKEELGRRRSRSASRGRFAESWKRLSSRQSSTKRSGLASQQPPVSRRLLWSGSLWRPFCVARLNFSCLRTPFSQPTCPGHVSRGPSSSGHLGRSLSLSSERNWRPILTGRGRELRLVALRQIKARGVCWCNRRLRALSRVNGSPSAMVCFFHPAAPRLRGNPKKPGLMFGFLWRDSPHPHPQI